MSGNISEIQVTIFEEIDELIEGCRKDSLSLKEALERILPKACELTGAIGAAVKAHDEKLELKVFPYGEWKESWEKCMPDDMNCRTDQRITNTMHKKPTDVRSLVICPLDCVDIVVGTLVFVFPTLHKSEKIEETKTITKTVSEQLDNYVHAIFMTAKKQWLKTEIANFLNNRIFGEGADKTITLLSKEFGLNRFLLVYWDPDVDIGRNLLYRFYVDGELINDSTENPSDIIQSIIELGIHNRENTNEIFEDGEIIIFPITTAMSREKDRAGDILLQTSAPRLSPEAHDIIEHLIQFLFQRLIDLNRERRILSGIFSPKDTARLMRETGYWNNRLSPRREENTVSLFTDICSSTAVSEKALGEDPEKIWGLLDPWLLSARDIIFKHQGTLGDISADRVLGLFGFPFLESSVEERIINAIRTALEIADFTKSFGERLNIGPDLKRVGLPKFLQVSSGINIGPAAAGLLNANNTYTALSSDMNLTARIQDKAGHGQILISKRAAEIVRDNIEEIGVSFVEFEPFEAKNVHGLVHCYSVERI